MAIEIVDFPVKNGDFPFRYVSLPEGTGMFVADETATLMGMLGSNQ